MNSGGFFPFLTVLMASVPMSSSTLAIQEMTTTTLISPRRRRLISSYQLTMEATMTARLTMCLNFSLSNVEGVEPIGTLLADTGRCTPSPCSLPASSYCLQALCLRVGTVVVHPTLSTSTRRSTSHFNGYGDVVQTP